MNYRSVVPALLLAASLSAGCNLSPGQIKQLVDQGKQIAQKLADAGVKLQIADATGKQVALTKADVKQVFLDGKEVTSDQFDVVNGEIKFKDLLEMNSGQKSVKVVLKSGLVIDNVKIDTTEGRASSTEAKFIAGPGGRLSQVDAGKSLEDAAKERVAKARQSGVVVKLGVSGLNDGNIVAVGFQAAGSGKDDPVFVLPRSAFRGTPDGGIVFDVQFLSVLTATAQATGATDADIKDADWYVVHKTASGGFSLHHFNILKVLKQVNPETGEFPEAQILDDAGADFSEPSYIDTYDTFAELTYGTTLVELDEFGRMPEDWANHKVDGDDYGGEDPYYDDRWDDVEWDYEGQV